MISVLALLLPLLSALLCCAIGGRSARSAVATVLALLTFGVVMSLPGSSAVEIPWLSGLGVYFYLSPEGAASVLALFAALVMIPTVLYASLKIDERPARFVALLFVMQAGLNGVFLARDLVLYYIFWEATLIPSVLMLGIWGGERRRGAAMKYLLYAVAGSFLMLVAILAIKPLSGAMSYRFEDLLAATPQLPAGTQLWLFIGFALAFAVKLPLWPVHAWLPDFHEQNHPSGVADVAGTLYKVGGWGFFAWALPLLPEAARLATPALLALAAFTALYAAMIAASQENLKRLLAYASLSHMGIVGVGVFGLHIAGLSGAMYLLAAQMVSTGGLFLISGMLYERRKNFDLAFYGGLAKSAPALAGVTLLVLFASIGVPGLANFPGEFMSLLGAYQTHAWLAAFATLAVIAAAVYGVNLYQRLYQGEETWGETRELAGLELLVLVPIVTGILWLGIAPQRSLALIEAQSQIVAEQHAARLEARVSAETEGLELDSVVAPAEEGRE